MTIRDHMPDVVFILWLMTGQYYYLEKLQMQADRAAEPREASGNPSVSENFSFTAPTQSSSGIPPTLGWYQIPNTRLAPQCPNDPTIQGATGCAAVISAWSGGMADTTRNRLIIWGGGHNDYYGNEVYALDLNSLSMKRIINPSPPNPTPDVCVTTLSDGRPNSRHTYAGLAYLTHVDRMFVFGGVPACNLGGFSNDTWVLNMAALQWQSLSPSSRTPGANQVASAYDPNSHKEFLHVQGQLWSYNYDTNTYSSLPGDGLSWNQKTGVVDPKRQLFFAVGSGELGVTSIAAGSSFVTRNWASQASGCAGWVNGTSPGSAYDPVQDRIVGWVGGDTVYLFNPDTKSCTTQTFSGGPGAAQGNGTFGRWQYFPALGVFIVVNDWQQNAYSLRMTTPSGSTQARPTLR